MGRGEVAWPSSCRFSSPSHWSRELISPFLHACGSGLTLMLASRIEREHLTLDPKRDITTKKFFINLTFSPFVRIYSSYLIGSCLAHS